MICEQWMKYKRELIIKEKQNLIKYAQKISNTIINWHDYIKKQEALTRQCFTITKIKK